MVAKALCIVRLLGSPETGGWGYKHSQELAFHGAGIRTPVLVTELQALVLTLVHGHSLVGL